MRTAIPPLTAQADERKHRLQRAHDGPKKPRLQMLSRLASGQTQTRQEVARLLGVHRQTLGRWLAISAAGGVETWLQTDVPAGNPVSLAPAVLASLEATRHRPEGFASSEARRQWGWRTHGVPVTYQTRYPRVRTRFRATLKVPRPSHTTKA